MHARNGTSANRAFGRSWEGTAQHRADTFYDQRGRIVFTVSKGLPGVGFPRPEWNAIKGMQSGIVTRTITDTTLPTGPCDCAKIGPLEEHQYPPCVAEPATLVLPFAFTFGRFCRTHFVHGVGDLTGKLLIA